MDILKLLYCIPPRNRIKLAFATFITFWKFRQKYPMNIPFTFTNFGCKRYIVFYLDTFTPISPSDALIISTASICNRVYFSHFICLLPYIIMDIIMVGLEFTILVAFSCAQKLGEFSSRDLSEFALYFPSG